MKKYQGLDYVAWKKITTFLILVVSLVLSSCSIKPTLVSSDERITRISNDLKAMFDSKEPVKMKLTMYQAMARAIKYNLDLRLKAYESAYARIDASVSSVSMLPQVLSSAGYDYRNNDYAITSPQNPEQLSSTEDRNQRNYSVQFGWDSLDFGLSYINSIQKGNFYLISEERKRKVIQQVIRNTRNTFWRAWGAKQILRDLKPFNYEIEQAIRQSKIASQEKLVSPEKSAYYQAELWKTYKDILNLQSLLINAEPELISLINVKPNTKLTLLKPKHRSRLPKNFPTKLHRLHLIALQDRSELREEDYKHRISLDEITKAQLKLLPKLELKSGFDFDSNSYLVNPKWNSLGLRVSWDIMRIFSYGESIILAKKGVAMADVRRMALSMAVMTQTTIAKLRYMQAKQKFRIVLNLRDSRYQVYRHLLNKQQSKMEDHLTMIDAKAKWLLARLDYLFAYAELENAAGQLLDTVGYDPLHSVSDLKITVDELAQKIKLSLTYLPGYHRDVDNAHSIKIAKQISINKPIKLERKKKLANIRKTKKLAKLVNTKKADYNYKDKENKSSKLINKFFNYKDLIFSKVAELTSFKKTNEGDKIAT